MKTKTIVIGHRFLIIVLTSVAIGQIIQTFIVSYQTNEYTPVEKKEIIYPISDDIEGTAPIRECDTCPCNN